MENGFIVFRHRRTIDPSHIQTVRWYLPPIINGLRDGRTIRDLSSEFIVNSDVIANLNPELILEPAGFIEIPLQPL